MAAPINCSAHINKRALKIQDHSKVINEQEICLSSLESNIFLREKKFNVSHKVKPGFLFQNNMTMNLYKIPKKVRSCGSPLKTCVMFYLLNSKLLIDFDFEYLPRGITLKST